MSPLTSPSRALLRRIRPSVVAAATVIAGTIVFPGAMESSQGFVRVAYAAEGAGLRSLGPDPPGLENKARAKEYRIKAALLFNFLKYTTFPEGTFANDSSPIVVVLVGDDPFGPMLQKVLGSKKIAGRAIQIRRLRAVPSKVPGHLVFTTGLKEKQREALIELAKGKPCLLVGEAPGFAEAGGFINLYKVKGKIRFEINVERQRDTGITIKAELLKLARIVGEPTPKPKPKSSKPPSGSNHGSGDKSPEVSR